MSNNGSRRPSKDNTGDPSRTEVHRIERPLSLVAQVEKLLRKAIAEGRYPDGKLPTAIDLAEQFGVSRETVRRAAETLQKEGLLIKIRRKGTFIHSSAPSSSDVKPAAGTVVAYLQARYKAPEGRDERATQTVSGLILQGAVEAAGEFETQLVVRNAPHTELGKTFQQVYQQWSVQGAIFAHYGEEKLLRKVTGLDLPIALVDHDLNIPQISSVRDDSFEGARTAISYLVELGHRRIACAHWRHAELNPWRIKGYRRGLRDGGLGCRRLWEIPAELTDSGAVHVVDKLLDISPRPTAVFCFNNTLAGLVLDELKKRGIDVPGKVSVIGAGGEDIPGLTCLQADWYAIGREALTMVLRGIRDGEEAHPQHKVFAQSLREGMTTAPPAAA